MTGPLSGLSVVELAGMGPAPHAGMMLSDMGADVVRVDRLPAPDEWADLETSPADVYLRGRRSIAVDLKTEAGRGVLLRLIADADVLIEGFRPGVLERLGLAPERLLAANPRLVIGRVTGWGQNGPNASMAGHDLNYIALAGALHGIGRPDSPPPPPLNYIGDFGGGSMLLLFGVLCAVIEAHRSGRGQVVDAAMVDGVAALGAALYGQLAKGLWTTTRGANHLDGSAPHYDSYLCRDGRYITIAPLEPQFYAELCRLLELDGPLWDDQHDRSRWAERKRSLAEIFAGRDQEEWCQLLDGTDACFAPVLSLVEATTHPHNVARETFVTHNDVIQPAPAPRLSRTKGEIRRPPPHVGEHTIEILAERGFTGEEIQTLFSQRSIAAVDAPQQLPLGGGARLVLNPDGFVPTAAAPCHHESEVSTLHPNRGSTPSTLLNHLARHERRSPDKTIFDFPERSFSYAEFVRESAEVAAGFRALGIRPGDRVCTLLDNSADNALTIFAVMRINAIVVPLNVAYTGEFLRYQVNDSGARALVTESAYVEHIMAIQDGLPELRTVLVRDWDREDSAGVLDVKPFTWLRRPGADIPLDAVAPPDPAILMYTSGTTGRSKGCVITHGGLESIGRNSRRVHDLTAESVIWTPMPMFHMGCLGQTVAGSLVTGCTAALAPRFSVHQFWPEVLRSKATVVKIVSVMLTRVAEAPDTEDSLKARGQVRMIAGAPMPESLQSLLRERFDVPYCANTGYGMTEATSIVLNDMTRHPAPPNSSGQVGPDFDMRIVNPDGTDAPAGKPGEIWVRPRHEFAMMAGYWNDQEATASVFDGPWFKTGDIGRLDDVGWFYFVDRAKDYLRAGGENISSFEMEQAIARHPDIADVAVHAVASQESEDAVKVTAVLAEGSALTPNDLWLWCQDRLPRFAQPRYIEFRTDIPRNPVGRILHFQLRDEGVTDSTWAAPAHASR